MIRNTTLVIFLLLQAVNLLGQNDEIIVNETYADQMFKVVVEDLEQKYPLTFYYDQAWDSISVTLQTIEAPLSSFLEDLSNNTGLHFYIKPGNKIIVTRQFKIEADLSSYFTPIENTKTEQNYYSILESIRATEEEETKENIEDTLIEIGELSKRYQGEEATIEGYLKEEKTGEPLVGASITTKASTIGVVTDAFGYYSLTLPKGDYNLSFNFIGMKPTQRKVALYSDGELTIEMTPNIVALKEVEITGEKNNVNNIQTGIVRLDMKNIKQIPTVLGEADIMKIILTLPGVQNVGEGSSGINVRGGGGDQNLILINDTPVYNPNHLFGFFSAFNADVLSSANLYKSGIQANYGGRISSVLDIALRDGNKKKYSVKGGISPITGKVTVEGPLKKDASSFILGLRSTYSNWMLSLLEDPAIRNSDGAFSDVIAKVNYQLNDKNNLVVSAYHSRDKFRLNGDSLYRYVNNNASVQWRHLFSNKFYAFTSASFIDYSYDLSSEQHVTNAFKLDYKINQTNFKTDFNYFPNANHSIRFGLNANWYNLQPGERAAVGDSSVVLNRRLNTEKGLETAAYFGNEFEVSPRVSLYGGIRFSMFNALGAGKSYIYQPENTREVESIIDSTSYRKGEVIKTYGGPELRLSAKYKLKDGLALKFSYDRTRQYIHLLSNTTAISPTDTWRLSGAYIKPQIGDQVSLGLYKTVLDRGIEISLETYYKRVNNVLEYKNGADLLLNEILETDVINAKMKTYGIEFLIRRNTGKLTGWINYTYSRSLIKAFGAFPEEQINDGAYYPSNFDKPHNLVLITNFKFNRRKNISLNMTYNTGRPATYPVGKYQFNNQNFLLYSDRNQFRIPDYFRVDAAFNFEGNHKVKKLAHGSWTISVYNLTGRANAYSIYYKVEDGKINGYKLSIFGTAIPTITYNFDIR